MRADTHAAASVSSDNGLCCPSYRRAQNALIRFRHMSHCPDVPAGNLASYKMSGKVVGDDKQPKFPEQSQEFIGTVRQCKSNPALLTE